jgi:hypothetical protein
MPCVTLYCIGIVPAGQLDVNFLTFVDINR